MNNLRQISSGMLSFVNSQSRFPNAATFGDPGTGEYTRQISSRMLRILPAEDPTNPDGHDYGPLRSWVVDILPDLDQATLYNDMNRERVYFDSQEFLGGVKERNFDYFHTGGKTMGPVRGPTNLKIGETSIRLLTCPSDDSVLPGQGNLSYAVNMGFARWAGLPDSKRGNVVWGTSWQGSTSSPNHFTWGTPDYSASMKTAVFFVGTASGKAPWDMFHTLATIRDGTSTTIMLAENCVGGASPGGPPFGWTLNGQSIPTNWATAHPNFVGFIASSEICGTGPRVECPLATDLAPTPGGQSGGGWLRANAKGLADAMNYGSKSGIDKGGHPFANSMHPGGIVVSFCDGSVRFLSETIDGAVWAKLITPDGQTLPSRFAQTPLQYADVDGAGLTIDPGR